LQRLSQDEAGHLVYQMKHFRGGSLFLLLTPDDLLAKLASLVPPPRVHAVRYSGVFAHLA
jgi:putative transposase